MFNTSAAVGNEKGSETLFLRECGYRYLSGLIQNILDSPKLLEALASVRSNLKIENNMPELSVETRWNSTWLMVSNVINIRKPLEKLLRRIRDHHAGYVHFNILLTDLLCREINSETWFSMEDFCVFLKSFYDATNLMSASVYPTIAPILLLYQS